MQRLDAITHLDHLKHGGSVNCVTPDGIKFQIQSKLSHTIAFYRARPARRGCLNKYSRLSDDEVIQWLSSQRSVTPCTD